MKKIIILFTLFLSFYTVQAQEAIPFTMTPSGHIVVKVSINDVDGKFIFDTGAGLNLVTKTFYDKLKNVTTEGLFYTAFRATGDRLDVQLYKAQHLKIGKFRYEAPTLTYLDLNWGDLDGIISLKNFENAIVTIDYAKSVLIIEETKQLAKIKKSAKTIVPIQVEDSRNISIDIACFVKLNDTHRGQFILDSGAGKNIFRINSRYLSPLNIDVSDTLKVQKKTFKSDFKANHENNIYTTTVAKLALDSNASIAVEQQKVQFVDGLIYDGIMPIDWFGKKITISIPTKEIVITE
ncbi:retropepsin-like aspartic protease [Flavobacterium sp. '19STA2R22 D10 B1']|uniref:retropepsin-like aspartic protease n=1 Tax=Flavobacterium aerium TaxID=3037261 RepID=UPI00278C2873|nr:retropepsin-like aspartic protease [Flavobacterium sp. '19STA2R22 D10 B1']